MPEFIPGLELSRIFYEEAVGPLLAAHFPGMLYAAALLGSGSEVLGFDTPVSTDHHWGPRLFLFLPEDDYECRREEIAATLAERLPYEVRGYSTNFGPPDAIGVQLRRPIAAGPVNHWVRPATVGRFVAGLLGVDPHAPLAPRDWLTFPEQRLLELTAGAVYHDGPGELTAVRRRFAYYPRDVWLYRLAAQWKRISQEEAFMGRCGHSGDDFGSQIVAARLVRDLMRLAFLLERTYAPYSKWFGTAFARLRCADALGPFCARALAAATWREREEHLSGAYRVVARQHNALGVTPPLPEEVAPYYDRPYLTLRADHFAAALCAAIADEEIRHIAGDYGAVDQFVDCTDVTMRPELCRRLGALYE